MYVPIQQRAISSFAATDLYLQHINIKFSVGFEVLTAVSMKIAVFWVVASCSRDRPDDGGSKDL
jgi:hypothetical protein